jgi:TRAP-type C4-dicarboxylate transport system substrate-binding protein
MGTLGAPPQGYESVVKGIADMAWHPDSFTPGRFAMTELLDLPIGVSDNIIASKTANEYYNRFKPKEFNDVYMLFIGMSPPNYIHTKKPVKTIEDLKGMKIKTLGSTQSDYITALGAVPVAMPTPEVYDSISKGVIEGFVGTYEAMMTFKLNEVTSYTVESPHTTFSTAAFLVANKKKWDSIPPNSKNTLEQMVKELEQQVPKVFGDGNKQSREAALKAGHHVTILSATEDDKWATRVKPVLDKEVKDRAAKGLPAQDALKFIQDSLKSTKK